MAVATPRSCGLRGLRGLRCVAARGGAPSRPGGRAAAPEPRKRAAAFLPAAAAAAATTEAAAGEAEASAGSGGGGGGGYPFADIEQRWQAHWEANRTFATPALSELDASKPKYYALDMFPYPSGAGLHVGHPEGYTATDIMARYKRMTGHNVLHPMGWDAFGLPAEQYAIDTGTHPKVTTETNVNRFREQLKMLGFSYDWDRELATCHPKYYKWTQWIFLQLLERGLAYQAEVPVNWCPALGTVLANEEVVDGVSERGGHPVIRKPMKQWMLKITAYGDRLLEDLDELDWPDSIKEMQRNWIGRSEGAEIDFTLEGGEKVTVFTTRPDTLFGCSYMVLAPEHPLVASVTTDEQRAAVEEYCDNASKKSDLERTELQKDKTGVLTGAFATNPINGERVPVWVADYVLGSYGTGAVMAVPAHDDRDYEFAAAYGLPAKTVVVKKKGAEPAEGEAYTAPGVLVNSANADIDLAGWKSAKAKAKVIEWLEENDAGRKKVNFKLRDWLFARQRYWGEPFPVVFPEDDPDTPVPVPESELPLELPPTEVFKPSGEGEGPLANLTDWVSTTDPRTGKPARRETSTMPQWAGSCWYYLRFIDPDNESMMIDPEVEKYWMPVDLYVGGAEHAVLHLLYARFWHKVLYDIGVVTTKEPFQRLVSQGMILGETEYTAFRDGSGAWVAEGTEGATAVKIDAEDVEKKGKGFVLKEDESVVVGARAHKMSKSRGNVVNPDDVVASFGADSLRLYEMFMGPLTETKTWSTRSVEGVYRFLARAHRLFAGGVTDDEPTKEQLRDLHLCIGKVTDDTEGFRFNTAISSMMEFINAANKWETKPRAALEPFCLLLAPYAPHLAEELWSQLGHAESLAYEAWPEFKPELVEKDTVTMAVQVNGKMRGTIEIPKGADEEAAKAAAMASPEIAKHVEGKKLKRFIYREGKIMNWVVA